MAETPDRPKRPGGPPKNGRPGSARPAKGKPQGSGRPRRDADAQGRPARDNDRRPRSDEAGAGRPKRDGDRPYRGKPDGAGSDRPKRDGDRPYRGKPDGAGSDRPKRDGDRPYRGKPEGAGSGRPRRDAGPKRDGEKRLWTRDGKPARGDRDARDEIREDKDPLGLRSVRTRHDAPEIPDDVQAKDLDRVARAQLKTLSADNADWVARHLVMTARLIDTDPKLAHEHAVSAARRAGRIAVVRETLAITAYATGDYALALRELRTYRRISGRDDQLPMMVDSERGLGRPERALELGRTVPRATLSTEVQVELAIAMSGARLDLGQTDAALVELQIPQLDPERAFPWSPALFDAYATVLEDLGHTTEAEQWYARSTRATAALMAQAADEDDEEPIEIVEEELPEDE
ncbi:MULTISPECIES: primosomal protein [unclassified Cryobacterium]|uniref:primosomal protein n=1 Tax=unclassified Cryobacterium TaxID=2649013 RepID=UPI001B2FFBD1|nr:MULTISPECIES: primosomal protein [unclassified Cryobacterium]